MMINSMMTDWGIEHQADPEKHGVEVGQAGGEMGKDQFMQLLVVQMQNQDPLDPVDNKEMIAQLAQFSALEQMQNLNSRFEAFQESISGAVAASLIGREVMVKDPEGFFHGLVEGLSVDGDQIKVALSNGMEFDLSAITGIWGGVEHDAEHGVEHEAGHG